MFLRSSAGSCHVESMPSIHWELRSPNAVSPAPTREIAPPMRRTITSVSFDGRRFDQSTVVSIAVSEKPEIQRLPVPARARREEGVERTLEVEVLDASAQVDE